MGFNLDRQPKKIHAEINLVIGEEECKIMAAFRPLPTNKDVDEFIKSLRTLQDRFEANPEFELLSAVQDLAAKVFAGWVNPGGREDLWVTSNGAAVECNPSDLARFLAIPGASLQICQEYVSTIVSGKAALGNSGPLPVSGAPPDAVAPNPTT